MDVQKFQGAWGYDVDSVAFVRELRRRNHVCPVTCLNNCRTPGQCQYCGEGVIETERLVPGDIIFELLEECNTLSDLYGWQQSWRDTD